MRIPCWVNRVPTPVFVIAAAAALTVLTVFLAQLMGVRDARGFARISGALSPFVEEPMRFAVAIAAASLGRPFVIRRMGTFALSIILFEAGGLLLAGDPIFHHPDLFARFLLWRTPSTFIHVVCAALAATSVLHGKAVWPYAAAAIAFHLGVNALAASLAG